MDVTPPSPRPPTAQSTGVKSPSPAAHYTHPCPCSHPSSSPHPCSPPTPPPRPLPAAQRAEVKAALDQWAEEHKGDNATLQLLDVAWGRETYVPITNHCRHRFLLHLPGVSGSGRCSWRWGKGTLVSP